MYASKNYLLRVLAYYQCIRGSTNLKVTVNLILSNQLSFNGWKNPDSKCLLVTDLSSTLVTMNPNEVKKIPKVFDITKQHNGYIVYATSASLEDAHGILNFAEDIMGQSNVDIHKPDFIITEGGRAIYSYIDGAEKKIEEYSKVLESRGTKPPTKATGVRFLEHFLNVPPEEKVMIGDGALDRQMLKLAFREKGYFICPDNACKKLKRFAKTFHSKHVIMVDKCGARAILKGLSKIIQRHK